MFREYHLRKKEEKRAAIQAEKHARERKKLAIQQSYDQALTEQSRLVQFYTEEFSYARLLLEQVRAAKILQAVRDELWQCGKVSEHSGSFHANVQRNDTGDEFHVEKTVQWPFIQLGYRLRAIPFSETQTIRPATYGPMGTSSPGIYEHVFHLNGFTESTLSILATHRGFNLYRSNTTNVYTGAPYSPNFLTMFDKTGEFRRTITYVEGENLEKMLRLDYQRNAPKESNFLPSPVSYEIPRPGGSLEIHRASVFIPTIVDNPHAEILGIIKRIIDEDDRLNQFPRQYAKQVKHAAWESFFR